MINFDVYNFLKTLSNRCLSYGLLLGRNGHLIDYLTMAMRATVKFYFKFNNENEFIYSERGNLKIKNDSKGCEIK